MKTSEYAQGVAMTIFDQMGGNVFTVMTGANNFQYGTTEQGDFLRFSLQKAKNKIQWVQIVYDLGNDVYIFKFKKADGSLVSETGMVHVEDMHELFENETGLYTSI